MSNSSKGTRIEATARDHLVRNGYVVHRAVRTPVVVRGRLVSSNANDIFGVFDLLATRPDTPERAGDIRFVQVTVISQVAARRTKVATVLPFFPADCVSIEVWGWVEGRRSLKNPNAQTFGVWRWSYSELTWELASPEVVEKPAARELLAEV